MKHFLLFILSAFSCFTFSQTLNNSLTACYAFNGGATDPISNLTGTLSNATAVADRFTYPLSSYSVNGTTGSYIELPDNPLIKPSNNITFSGWVKPAVVGTAQIVFTKNTTTANIGAYQLGITTFSTGFCFQASKADAFNYNVASGTSSISANTWYHVAFTMDNSAIRLYVNGVLQSSTTVSFPGFDYASAKNVYLGGTNEPLVNNPFNGIIDNVKFYNRALGAGEIFQLYQVDPTCVPVPPISCDAGYYVVDQIANTAYTSNWFVPNVANLSPLVLPPNCNGLAIGPPLGFPAPIPTFWAYSWTSSTYWYHNGYHFVNTGHSHPTSTLNLTAKLGGSKNYVYAMEGAPGSVYKYNGSSTPTLVLAAQPNGYSYSGPWDLVGDDLDNFYVMRTMDPKSLSVFNQFGVLTCSYSVSGLPNQFSGAGLAIKGNVVVMHAQYDYYVGTLTGSNVDFTLTPMFTPSPIDFASCMVISAFQSNITAAPSTSISCFTPSITLTANAPTSLMSYTWSGPGIISPANNQSVQVNLPGFYTCSLTSCPGGTSIAVFNVLSGPSSTSPSITASGLGLISCATPSVQLSVLPNSGNYSTFWNGLGINSPNNSSTISVVSGGPYSVAITNTLTGCVGYGTIYVNSNIGIFPASPFICSGNNASLTVSGALGYTWSPGGTTGTVLVVSPTVSTVFTVTADYGAGCLLTGISNILVTTTPTLTLSPATPTLCAGKSVTLAAVGAVNYTWNPGNQSGNMVTVSPLSTTIFTASANNDACIGTKTINVVVYDVPNISASASPSIICEGSPTMLMANNATTYTWQPGNLAGGTVTDSPAASVNYTVSGTDILGCYSSTTVSVTVNFNPTVSSAPATPTICYGSSRLLTANGASSYLWAGTGNMSQSIFVNPTSTTFYSVTGYNLNCSSTATALVTVWPVPIVTITPANPTVCNVGVPTTLNAGGNAISYTWSPSGSTNSVIVVSPTVTSNYMVTGSNSLGCTSSTVVQVTVDTPTIIAGPNGYALCLGGTVNIYANGASTYTWYPGQMVGQSVPVSPSVTLTYTVIGTSVTGCTATSTRLLYVYPNPTVVISASQLTLCSGSSTTLTASGATGITWLPGPGSSSVLIVSPLTNTTYTALGYLSGCSSTAAVSLTVIPLPSMIITGPPVIPCSGQQVTLSATGAGSYTWNPGSLTGATVAVTPTVNSVYSITGFSAGCSNIQTYVLSANPLPLLNVNVPSVNPCSGQPVVLSATGASSYTWSPGNLTGSAISVTPVVSSIYSLTGSLAGCLSSQTFTLDVNLTPTVSAASSSASVCIGQPVNLNAGGASTYTWMPGNTSGQNISVVPPATMQYTVTGSSVEGCSATAVTSVTVNTTPTISAVANPSAICSGNTTTLTAAGALTYTWYPGSANGSSISVTVITGTGYTVTGANSFGCIETKTIMLLAKSSPTVTINNTTPVICIGQSAGMTAMGAATYTWSGGITSPINVVSPLVTTVYTVTGSIANGCANTVTTSVQVSECTALPENKNTENTIRVYPNPNSGEFYIDLEEPTQVTIYNALGQLVFTRVLFASTNLVDLSIHDNGIYFIQCEQNNRLTNIFKIIKN